MAYSIAVRGCSSMARRLARFLRRRLQRRRWSPGGWGHGWHVWLPPVRSLSCTAGSPNLWFVFIGHYCFWLFCYFRCDLTLLLSVILLFLLWFDVIAFGYFVISIVIWHCLLPIIMSIMIELNMSLLLSVICCSLWEILPLLAYCHMYFVMVFLKRQK